MLLPRFRIRTLMIAVAAVAMVLGSGFELIHRRNRFRRCAASHRAPWLYLLLVEPQSAERNARLRWHERMQEKYAFAARYPWLPVLPDPPETE